MYNDRMLINILLEIKSITKNGLHHFEGFTTLKIKPMS